MAPNREKGKGAGDGRKIIASNRRARHDYAILDTIEAGIVLAGTEVKSLRAGQGQLQDAYVDSVEGELWLKQANISPYAFGTDANHDPLRPRKLLLRKAEITKITAKVVRKGLTIVPLSLLFVGKWVKVELAVVRGRKLHDKLLAPDAELLAKGGLGKVKLEIVKAEYGAGATQKDVTGVLQKQAAEVQLVSLPMATYNESFGGDPAPGVVKQLRVQYKINGKDGSATFAENALIVLPMPK